MRSFVEKISTIPGWLVFIGLLIPCIALHVGFPHIPSEGVGWTLLRGFLVASYFGAYMGWCLCFSRFLGNHLPESERCSLKWVTICFGISILFLCFGHLTWWIYESAQHARLLSISLLSAMLLMKLLFFVTLAAIFALVSGYLSHIELGRSATFREVFLTMFVLLISLVFPLGLWWVSARARRRIAAMQREKNDTCPALA